MTDSAAPPLPASPSIWVLADDRAGNRAQCLGVAEALGLPFDVRDIAYGRAAAVPNRLLGPSFFGLTADSRRALAPPWPDMVIAAGRRTAPVARAIKKRNQGATFLVQVMDPGGGLDDFDVVAVPHHDRRRPRPNVIATIGAPHRVTPAALRQARETWAPRFAALPTPRLALIVGGSTKSRPFTPEMAGTLGQMCCRLAADAGGSLLISTSRRTGDAPAAALLAELDVPKSIFRWDQGGDNPYLGYLAVADAVIVTGDSMSMCTEACATTAPVYIYAPPGFAVDKHARLHQDLYDRGCARPLGESLEAWTHPPLNPADDVARAIRQRFGLQ